MKTMDNLLELERFIRQQGWFGGTLELVITLKSAFEGFSGRASETWEQQVTIEIKSPDKKICPDVKLVSKEAEWIDDVAKRALATVKNYNNNINHETT